MKVLVSALVVGFALLIALVPSSDAIICSVFDGCETKLSNGIGGGIPEVDCDECAGWGCYYNNTYYYGMGCKNDSKNFCNTGNNQKISYEDEKGYFFTCSSADCNFDIVLNQMRERRDPKQMSFLSNEPCNVNDKRRKNDTIVCEKQNKCEGKSYKAEYIDVGGLDCDECAGWSCIINKTLYTGYGCKGDNNICKAGNNQNESEKYENSNWFISCNIDHCASRTLSEFMMKENATFSKENYNVDGKCDTEGLKYVLESTSTQLPCHNQCPHPKQLSGGKTTTSNSNEAKTNGVLKTAGMVLLGFLFFGF